MKMDEKNIPIKIPPFDDMIISREETEKLKQVFQKLTLVITESCHQFELHIAYYAISKLKDILLDEMSFNLDAIREEMERRKNEE